MKVWIVCVDGYVLKIFDSKEKAIRFLQVECELTTNVYQQYTIYERTVE